MFVRCAEPGDFFPGDVSVLEVTEHVHLTEDIMLVEQKVGVVDVARLFIVIVLIIAASGQLTATRRQQTPRLDTIQLVCGPDKS